MTVTVLFNRLIMPTEKLFKEKKGYISLYTVKPVLSHHIQQYIFLALQTGGRLLLHESMSFLCSFHSAISNHLSKRLPCHLNGWYLKTGLTVLIHICTKKANRFLWRQFK